MCIDEHFFLSLHLFNCCPLLLISLFSLPLLPSCLIKFYLFSCSYVQHIKTTWHQNLEVHGYVMGLWIELEWGGTGNFTSLGELQEAPHFCQFCSVVINMSSHWVSLHLSRPTGEPHHRYQFTSIRFLLCLRKAQFGEFLVLSFLSPGRSQGAICVSQHEGTHNEPWFIRWFFSSLSQEVGMGELRTVGLDLLNNALSFQLLSAKNESGHENN